MAPAAAIVRRCHRDGRQAGWLENALCCESPLAMPGAAAADDAMRGGPAPCTRRREETIMRAQTQRPAVVTRLDGGGSGLSLISVVHAQDPAVLVVRDG
jgi:hypothetical protein